MKNAAMRFAGYTFRHNPSKLVIEDAANIAGYVSPCTAPDSLRLGRKLRVIRGEGELYGEDCIGQYRALAALYERGDRGLLTLPLMPSMTAYLRELRMLAEPKEDVLSIAFTFLEAQGADVPVDGEGSYTVAQDGESLWDIAFHNGREIDALVRLNPQIRYINCLSAGEKVRLC